MTATAVIGAQWGDEGKGKIVDHLGESHRVAVRFNGGDNAGHSVVLPSGERHAVHLLPAAAYHPGRIVVLGRGMVVNPESLLKEIAEVREVNPELTVLVDDSAHIVLPYHRTRDAVTERERGKGAIGTTKRGNGPAYSDKASRIGLTFRLVEQMSDAELTEHLRKLHWPLTDYARPYPDDLAGQLREQVSQLEGMLTDAATFLELCWRSGGTILFAGAHGAMLDIDHGSYPFVTSSTCTTAGIGTSGFDVRKVDRVVGVVKAYSTRIAAGPFPSEIEDEELVQRIREAGREFGTTTGRPRRIGWLDFDALRYSRMVNGFDEIALTMADVLAVAQAPKIWNAGKLRELPPVDATMEEIQQSRSFADLPLTIRVLVQDIEMYLETPVSMISVGPRRDQLIVR
jgi:adenylosuccinate synthase